MKPLFHPEPINGPFEDPVIYIDFLFERRALLFDLGDIGALPPKKILRISHVFVSHAHMDHFIGFDRILRICLGRERQLHLFGPPGFIEQVEHKLAAYTWNLTDSYETDFTILVSEIHDDSMLRQARFRCRNRFQREVQSQHTVTNRIIVDEESFRIRAITLDHMTPCLAYALEEKLHINVWKNRLDELGLPTGAWLKQLKSAVRQEADDALPVPVEWSDRHGSHRKVFPLGQLRDEVLSVAQGQKIAYVVDCAGHAQNNQKILSLIGDSDILFIEAMFLNEDRDRAQSTAHLTAAQAGHLAKQAQVKRLVPLHFSPRYSDRPDALQQEAIGAWHGER
jgi:ribonuclease Z